MSLIGIRVDGGHGIGLGHVYKTLWLARTFLEVGFRPEFLATEDQTVRHLIESKGFPVHVLSKKWDELEKVNVVNQWIREYRPSVLIIDHWDWPEVYWHHLKIWEGTIFVAIDVPSEGFKKFDLAFQGIRNSLKNREFEQSGCRVYEGPRYLMLPPHYQRLNSSWKPSGKLEKILLTFGGTDVADFSLKILNRFQSLPGSYQLSLISGPGSLNHDRNRELAKRSHHEVEVLKEVGDIPERMCYSDLAITTSGLGTLSELALTGTPAIVVAAVNHQIENAYKFESIGGIINCAHKVGTLERSFDKQFNILVEKPKKLEKMSLKWNGLADGKGVERMTRIILERVQRGR